MGTDKHAHAHTQTRRRRKHHPGHVDWRKHNAVRRLCCDPGRRPGIWLVAVAIIAPQATSRPASFLPVAFALWEIQLSYATPSLQIHCSSVFTLNQNTKARNTQAMDIMGHRVGSQTRRWLQFSPTPPLTVQWFDRLCSWVACYA